MPGWKNSNRKSRLPSNWPWLRKECFRIKGRFCVHVREDTGEPCGAPATDVDHIKAGDNHDVSNLQPLCNWHHRNKSSSEGGYAKASKHKKRPGRRSPGLIYDD